MSGRKFHELKKHPNCAPGTWWWSGEGTEASGPTISCPKCQALHGLDHKISADGELDPSVVCTRCDFHEYARLLGWTYGEKDFRTT